MPAVDWLQPQQLSLFLTGSEWKGQITHSTDGPLDAMWAEKTARSKLPASSPLHGAGVYNSIKEHGYRSETGSPPATMLLEEAPNGRSIRTVQSEGHHRVAAAAALEEDTAGDKHPRTVYLPTHYVDNTPTGRRARKKVE